MFNLKNHFGTVLALLSFVCGCNYSSNESNPRVAFGTPLDMGAAELQYSVLVLGSQFGCSGAVVGPHHIVTSAVCLGRFEDLRTEPRFIFETKIEVITFAGQRPESIRALSAVRHPYYQFAADNSPFSVTNIASTDIALIVLEKPIQTKAVKIALPNQKLTSPLKLTGFGSDENEFTSGRPRTAVSKHGWNGAKLDNGYGIIAFMKGNGAPCDGDGGAPVLSDEFLVGTVSMVRRTVGNLCRTTESATLTDIRLLRGWLRCSAEQMKFPLIQVSDAQPDRWCEKNQVIQYKL